MGALPAGGYEQAACATACAMLRDIARGLRGQWHQHRAMRWKETGCKEERLKQLAGHGRNRLANPGPRDRARRGHDRKTQRRRCSDTHCKQCSQNFNKTSTKPREIPKEPKPDENVDVDISDKNLILTLIQQNNELQKQMLEVIKNGTNNTNISNSHNKSFKK